MADPHASYRPPPPSLYDLACRDLALQVDSIAGSYGLTSGQAAAMLRAALHDAQRKLEQEIQFQGRFDDHK